ncbi:MAG: hypothetical protein Q4G30_09045 [Actinomycetaceae bacterium]|nr:hypothetical protein [Actinomycetaceae bacterium]
MSKKKLMSVVAVVSVSLLAALPTSVNAVNDNDEPSRTIVEPITGGSIVVYSEGICEDLRVEESVPGGDGLDRKLEYTITDECIIDNLRGSVTPSQSVTEPQSRSGLECRQIVTEHHLKDPVNLTISHLSMAGKRCWNGSVTYFSERAALAMTSLPWNFVTRQAYFTATGDTPGSVAALTAQADFTTHWVECLPSRSFMMKNSISSQNNGRYSTGFSHTLGCGGDHVHVETSHYER